jgi:phospholipid-translocating ATPase
MGILDQDVDDKVSLAVPQLYRRGIERKEWTQVKFWLYMLDGLYQSVICFYFTYLVFYTAGFNTESGRNVSDYKRFGVYIACPAVIVVNMYVMLNTYRWDWFMMLITSISILLIYFWTGVYTAFTDGFTFYGAAPQVYGALSFWAVSLLTVITCLLPRFAAKSFQKMYMPRDVDIVREEVIQGKFDYLKHADPANITLPPAVDKISDSASSSDFSKPGPDPRTQHSQAMSEDMRPIYPPSVAATATTHNARSQNGSDGTDYTGHRSSLDRAFPPAYSSAPPGAGNAPIDEEATTPGTPTISRQITRQDLDPNYPSRPSIDRARPSFDRFRSSMDRTRPSFEASRDFTSAAYLASVEGNVSQSANAGLAKSSRRHDITKDLGR